MKTLTKQLRPLLLMLLIFALVASGTPITESFAKWGRLSSVSRRKKNKRYRRHSRAWWRRHRALLRARRARAELRRAQRLAAQAANNSLTGAANATRLARAGSVNSAMAVSAPRLPFDMQLPHTWSSGRKNPKGDLIFAVHTPDGRATGTATLASIAVSAADAAEVAANPRAKSVGGASLAALRRTVIDLMVAEGGWVVNDMVREMNGRRVFVVLAQTGAPGAPSKSWTFYFTELDGRVYSLATIAPIEFTAPVAAGSEQVMASLRATTNSNVAAQQ